MEPIIPGEDQRQVAKIYISAFLETTLRGKHEYVLMFRDPRVIAEWLPDTEYRHRFEDSGFRAVADYEEDIDLSTATVAGGAIEVANLVLWREEALLFRDNDTQQNNAVYLGWSSDTGRTRGAAAHYAITLPRAYAHEQRLTSDALLVFSMSAVDDAGLHRREMGSRGSGGVEAPNGDAPGPLDLTIELVDTAGSTASFALSEFSAIPPVLHVQFLKLSGLSQDLYGRTWEPTLQTYELPLSSFVTVNPEFDVGSLLKVRFRFDLASRGVIILDEVGFRTGDRA
jgi:hypothetical protein